jgi:hypothetical protein
VLPRAQVEVLKTIATTEAVRWGSVAFEQFVFDKLVAWLVTEVNNARTGASKKRIHKSTLMKEGSVAHALPAPAPAVRSPEAARTAAAYVSKVAAHERADGADSAAAEALYAEGAQLQLVLVQQPRSQDRAAALATVEQAQQSLQPPGANWAARAVGVPLDLPPTEDARTGVLSTTNAISAAATRLRKPPIEPKRCWTCCGRRRGSMVACW